MHKLVVATAMGLGVLASPSLVLAQEATPPTTIEVEVSNARGPGVSTDINRPGDENDDDDDDGDAGLWGLLGLLGLIGLAGLLGRKRDTTGYSTGARISGDTT